METKYDVVVIGGGHNGMVAAGYLAKAGLSVCVVEYFKKGIFHQHGIEVYKAADLLGTVHAYVREICEFFSVPIEDVWATNIGKLRLRYPNGFTSADSVSRVDVHSETDEGDPRPSLDT